MPRKSKQAKVSKTTKKKSMTQIQKISINIGGIPKVSKDTVSLMEQMAPRDSVFPTSEGIVTRLMAPPQHYANVPQPLRRNVYANIPASMNPRIVVPPANGSMRDLQPNPPEVIRDNPNDIRPVDANRRAISSSSSISNLSWGNAQMPALETPSPSVKSERSSPSIPSTPLLIQPNLMLGNLSSRNRSFLDLIERDPIEAKEPFDQVDNVAMLSASNIASRASASNLPPISFSGMGSPIQIPQEAEEFRRRGPGRPLQNVEIVRPKARG